MNSNQNNVREKPALDSLAAIAKPVTVMGVFGMPDVKAVDGSRQARRRAEEERQQLAEVASLAPRHKLAIAVITSVAAYSLERMDDCQQAMVDQFLGRERHPTPNAVMADLTSELLQSVKAAILAFNQALPKLLGEKL